MGRYGRPGLTLIEVLFAITIMAVALLGVASMFPAALQSVMTGGQTSKATMLVREMVEMIQADTFDSLDTEYKNFSTSSLLPDLMGAPPKFTCPVKTPPDPGAFVGAEYNKRKWLCDLQAVGSNSGTPDAGQGLTGGVGSIRVDCLNPNGTINGTVPCPTDLRQVTVTITWSGQRARSVSLVTYVAKMG
ncbi:MAG TPA: prepilin-type N-terminal cleavage/methylation domain-containing protein [Candidatus Methylomirabilis sp.]|nr:prepilin-type N-terminal cleavage/methylation domain-containing protein [Candidatus Methylomirabilis sp.]HSD52245.1 prepilin-type N-terminal cleavage/methylation domain-containing protein [Candidatus Methylomirabilis sp.]